MFFFQNSRHTKPNGCTKLFSLFLWSKIVINKVILKLSLKYRILSFSKNLKPKFYFLAVTAPQEVNGCISLKSRDNKLNTCSQWQEKHEKRLCPECIAQLMRSKKSHYTIRRAPGKISHLIPASTSSDLIINFESNKKQELDQVPV